MIRILFDNVPCTTESEEQACRDLLGNIADACGISVKDVSVRTRNTKHCVFLSNGRVVHDDGICVSVEYQEDLHGETKNAIALFIHLFLVNHRIGNNSSIIFHKLFDDIYLEGKPSSNPTG